MVIYLIREDNLIAGEQEGQNDHKPVSSHTYFNKKDSVHVTYDYCTVVINAQTRALELQLTWEVQAEPAGEWGSETRRGREREGVLLPVHHCRRRESCLLGSGRQAGAHTSL